MGEVEKNDFENEKVKEIENRFRIHLVAETAIAIILLIAIFYFEYLVDKKTKEMQSTHLSARQYTLMVKGLPVEGLND